jgi:N-acetylmuramoyl-L-alanine amidase
MPSHSVKQGDTLISIAAEHDYPSWEVIWMDPGNAELRKKRPDPQVLSAGDTVVLPEKKTRVVHLATDKTHRLVVPTVKAFCRVVLRDDEGRPMANRRFQLEVGDKINNGTTNSDGVAELQVEPKAVDGKLKVFLDDADPSKAITWKVKLGHLDPIDKVSGVKARLTNLGFVCAKIDDNVDEETKNAVRNFQIVHRLPVTGEIDDQTKALLLALHDKR